MFIRQEEIRRLKDEKEMLYLKDRQATRTLEKIKEAVQSAVAEFESQQEITNEAIENASKCCPRMNTERLKRDFIYCYYFFLFFSFLQISHKFYTYICKVIFYF